MKSLSGRFSREALIAAAAALLFIAFSIWWLLYDQRLPTGGDPVRHLTASMLFADAFRDGDVLAWLTSDGGFNYSYPPLVRAVGMVVSLVGLQIEDWAPIALNVIFVPMLAAGCYLVGRMTFGALAGVLAVVFALGTPMLGSMFHIFLLDGPLVAVVALTVWALLASDGFSRRRECLIAGALIGLGLLIKTPAPVFVAGVMAVMLLRGGWRQGRNIALLALAAVVVAGPYYAIHLGDYVHFFREASVETTDPWTREHGLLYEGFDRFSPDSFGSYLWSAVNTQFMVPLLLLFVGGLVVALRDLRRRPYIAELLGGLAVGFLGMTMLSVHDPRYTLPLLVYVAVIATGWIAVTELRWLRRALAAAVVFIACLNVASSSLGLTSTVKLSLPGDDAPDGIMRALIDEGNLRIVDTQGFVVGEPRPDPFWSRLIDAAKRDGVRTVELNPLEVTLWGTDNTSFGVAAEQAGLETSWFAPEPIEDPDLIIHAWWDSGDYYCWEDGECLERACTTVEDGVSGQDSDGPALRVLVVRRTPDGGLERWCDF
jgi:4-amino-4-deoxy-L-arabinose transferase-like glycosyltransferase